MLHIVQSSGMVVIVDGNEVAYTNIAYADDDRGRFVYRISRCI